MVKALRLFLSKPMKTVSPMLRAQSLARFTEEHFDIVVIGGGVTGAGVALDAVARGYRVALVEKFDFAAGTSSKSTKLVHGGIRYLPNFDFAMVREALIERGLLLRNAPYLVQPVAFLMPIYEGDRHPVGMPFTTPGGVGLSQLLNLGLTLYDVLAGRLSVKRHYRLTREQVIQKVPSLVQDKLKEGFVYYDAQTNDARLTMALIRTAAQYGAAIANYAEVTSLMKDDQGQINGVRIHDLLGDQELTLRGRYVINATGVHAQQIEEMTGTPPRASIVPSKGVHLVFNRETLNIGNDALVLPETDDKRILFIVPWESRVVFGTTDTGEGDLDHPTASDEDVAYLLGYLNRYLNLSLSEKDIVSAYAGYRPLVRAHKGGGGTARLSRTHEVLESPSGLISIVGGKLTTYRRMAQDTLDVISKRDGQKRPVHPTEHMPLQGSAGWKALEAGLKARASRMGLENTIVEHLAGGYGTEMDMLLDLIEEEQSLGEKLISDLPYVRAEVVFACRREMAMRPADIFEHRTSISLEDRGRGRDALDEVATLMARELNWSSERRQQEISAYRDRVSEPEIVPAETQTQTTATD